MTGDVAGVLQSGQKIESLLKGHIEMDLEMAIGLQKKRKKNIFQGNDNVKFKMDLRRGILENRLKFVRGSTKCRV